MILFVPTLCRYTANGKMSWKQGVSRHGMKVFHRLRIPRVPGGFFVVSPRISSVFAPSAIRSIHGLATLSIALPAGMTAHATDTKSVRHIAKLEGRHRAQNIGLYEPVRRRTMRCDVDRGPSRFVCSIDCCKSPDLLRRLLLIAALFFRCHRDGVIVGGAGWSL
jgi:hypothetical protein